MSISPRGSGIIDAKLARHSPMLHSSSRVSLLSVAGAAGDSMADECSGAPLTDASGTRDLATLAQLTEETIVRELSNRYRQNIIYTNVGDILIAVNPFKDLPDLYGCADEVHAHGQRGGLGAIQHRLHAVHDPARVPRRAVGVPHASAGPQAPGRAVTHVPWQLPTVHSSPYVLPRLHSLSLASMIVCPSSPQTPLSSLRKVLRHLPYLCSHHLHTLTTVLRHQRRERGGQDGDRQAHCGSAAGPVPRSRPARAAHYACERLPVRPALSLSFSHRRLTYPIVPPTRFHCLLLRAHLACLRFSHG